MKCIEDGLLKCDELTKPLILLLTRFAIDKQIWAPRQRSRIGYVVSALVASFSNFLGESNVWDWLCAILTNPLNLKEVSIFIILEYFPNYQSGWCDETRRQLMSTALLKLDIRI